MQPVPKNAGLTGKGGGVSSVIEFKEVKNKKENPLVWKFDLNFDTLTDGKSVSGGNVNELPNSNILVCAGVLNRVFEVTRNKEIVWDAFIEIKRKGDTLWQAYPQYRCNWVKQLNRYHYLSEASDLGVQKPATSAVGQRTISIAIHNTGNADDSYDVEVLAGNADPVSKLTVPLVKKNSSFNKQLTLALPDTVSSITVMVRSKNSLRVQNLTLDLAQNKIN
jgi:hypothetical protein